MGFTTSNPSMSESVDRIDHANDIGKSGYVQRFEPNLPSNLRIEDMQCSDSENEEQKSNSPVPVEEKDAEKAVDFEKKWGYQNEQIESSEEEILAKNGESSKELKQIIAEKKIGQKKKSLDPFSNEAMAIKQREKEKQIAIRERERIQIENQNKKKIEIAMDMDMDEESEDEFFDEHEHDAFTTSNPSMSESVDRIDNTNDIGKSGYVQRFEPNLPS